MEGGSSSSTAPPPVLGQTSTAPLDEETTSSSTEDFVRESLAVSPDQPDLFGFLVSAVRSATSISRSVDVSTGKTLFRNAETGIVKQSLGFTFLFGLVVRGGMSSRPD